MKLSAYNIKMHQHQLRLKAIWDAEGPKIFAAAPPKDSNATPTVYSRAPPTRPGSPSDNSAEAPTVEVDSDASTVVLPAPPPAPPGAIIFPSFSVPAFVGNEPETSSIDMEMVPEELVRRSLVVRPVRGGWDATLDYVPGLQSRLKRPHDGKRHHQFPTP